MNLMQAKFIIFIVLLLVCTAGNAQFKKGNRLAGATIGSGNFSSGNTEFSTPTGLQTSSTFNHNWNINISPSYGWFITDRAIIGGNLLLNIYNAKTWIESASG